VLLMLDRTRERAKRVTEPMPVEKPLCEMSAADLLPAYESGAISPLSILDDVFSRIADWEPRLNALYAFDPDGAREQARESTERWRRKQPKGPLDGVPVTVKENIASKGIPVPLGTAAATLWPGIEDAPPVARLREAGAVIFSKTTMPDYGMLSSGLSSFHGITRNPWDLSKNPGGSSAGAGAGAAAGYGPLHLGTDIGGSVRLPACWCGIFALKPSLGRVPIDPPYVGRIAGPMTRTVADAALMMSVLSKPDPRDSMSLPAAEISWAGLDRSLKGVRMGLMVGAGCGMPLDGAVGAAVIAAAKAFEAEGAIIEEAPPIMTDEILNGLDNFWRARAWDEMARLPAAQRDKVLPFIRSWAEKAAQLSGVEVIRGFNATMTIRAKAARLFQSFDFVLSPVSPVLNFPADAASPLNDPENPFGHIAYTVPWNMSEQPAASINAEYSESGFPIGLQIVGKRFDDLGVLQIAKAFEAIRPAQRAWPQPSS
jgi:aspartyl-tRNA(Asn)/glutamyl-tRNA(Gln) amidotransferase subunit A